MASTIWICFMVLTMQESISSVMGPKENCSITNEKMTCEHTFPKKIKSNVTTVIIKDYQEPNIVDTAFTDDSWNKVTSLDITVNKELSFRLDKNNFIQLKMTLTFLGIHAPKLENINSQSFRELPHLRTLDLSHSVYITGNEIIASILDGELRLITLNLSYLSSGQQLIIDQNFLQMIAQTNIERLCLSGSNFILKGPLDVANLTFELNYFDISNTSISVIDVIHSREMKALTHFLKNLKYFDMSSPVDRVFGFDFGFMQNKYEVYKCNGYSYFEIISKAHTVFLNEMWTKKFYGNNSIFDYSACTINWKSLHLKGNNINYLNVTVIWPEENYFKAIDLSENGMEYLNPDFLYRLNTLEFIDLSGNKLSFMQRFKEFSSLFAKFRELRYCNISHNKFTFIPKHMFENNGKIYELDLSDNDLTSLTFDIVQFSDIRVLWLKNNRFKFLNERDFTKLDSYIQIRNCTSDIDITGNPFECSCKSTKFLKWVSSTLQPCTNNFYQCQLGDLTHSIDNTVIEKANYLCVKTLITITSTCVAIAIIMSLLFLIVFLYRKQKRMKQKRTKEEFLRDIRDSTQKHLCFLSFSSIEDIQFVTELGRSLDERLKRLTGIEERRLVCMGDWTFRPGYSVINEIFRVVDGSYVIVCLVSKKFCESKWCDLELRYAYENKKPIILILKENVQKSEMTKLLNSIFNTKTRAKLIEEEGECRLIPGYDLLSESIFELAINSIVDNDREA